MPVPSTLAELSVNASENSPLGSESPTTADNYFRAHAAFIKQVDEKAEAALGGASSIGIDLAEPTGAALVGSDDGAGGLFWSNVSGGLSFVRSSPIPLKAAIPSLVNDASVNYTTQIQAVLNFLRDQGGGRLILPPNHRIRASNLIAYSGTEIVGYDWSTVLESDAGAYAISVNPGTGGTTNPEDNQKNIALRGFKILGKVASSGFSQFVHLVNWNAISWSEIDQMCIAGFQGDGVYLGSSNVAATERHNEHIVIKRSLFDGINRDNRNGVSVIDGRSIKIENNSFRNCTRSNMPGAVDVEPDNQTFAVIRDIEISSNRFSNNGGNVADVAVFVPGNCPQPKNIRITNNGFQGHAGTGASVLYSDGRAATSTSEACGLVISGNAGKSGFDAFAIYSGRGGLLENNTFEDYTGTAIIGNTGAHQQVADLSIDALKMIRCSSVTPAGMSVFKAVGLGLKNSEFQDCGTGVPGAADAILFNAGESSGVEIENVKITSPTGKTLFAIQTAGAHTPSPATNKFFNNDFGTLPVVFQAENSDTLETAWTPVVTGSGSAGAGTYSLQYGRFRKIGKLVYFRLKVSASAGHTGIGMIQIGLPTLAAAAPSNEEMPVSLTVDGAATTGGQVGLINPALIVGGKGAIRVYNTTTGTIGQVVVPAGAFTVYASGTYAAA